ncbi:hypothetical protein Bca4012_072949 [Brassica carinata]
MGIRELGSGGPTNMEGSSPMDEELINFYQKNKILGNSWLLDDSISKINIYSYEPAFLPGNTGSALSERKFTGSGDTLHLAPPVTSLFRHHLSLCYTGLAELYTVQSSSPSRPSLLTSSPHRQICRHIRSAGLFSGSVSSLLLRSLDSSLLLCSRGSFLFLYIRHRRSFPWRQTITAVP